MTREEVFQTVDRLLALGPFTGDGVESVLRLRLELEPNAGNEFFVFLQGASPGDTPGALRAELRLPRTPAQGRDGLLAVDFSEPPPLTTADVIARYGPPTHAIPSRPESPDAPMYFRYERDDGVLSFGFLERETPVFTSVIIDRTERVAR